MLIYRTLDSSMVMFLVLLLISIKMRVSSEKTLPDHLLFMSLLKINMALIIIEVTSWVFDGRPGILCVVLNTSINMSLFLIEPGAAVLWSMYVNYQLFHDGERMKRENTIPLAIFGINAMLSLLSLYNGWFFKIGENNVYSRGSHYLLHLILCGSILIYSAGFLIKYRRLLERHYYYSLMFFVFPVIAGAVIQTLFYDISITWSCMALSLMLVYFNIQDNGLNTDYLTGVYNRRQLDRYLNDRIRSSSASRTFAAILIDLDNFKLINDRFGHSAGDRALITSAKLMKRSLGRDDFIARFGGDEFLIILNTGTREYLEKTVKKLITEAETFNNESYVSYRLCFSTGYDVYDAKSQITPDDFIRYLDRLMYIDKASKKSKPGNTEAVPLSEQDGESAEDMYISI